MVGALPQALAKLGHRVSVFIPYYRQVAKLVPDLPESPEFTRVLTRTWTRFRTGK